MSESGGTLRVLTPGAALDVRGGTNRLDAGLVDVQPDDGQHAVSGDSDAAATFV